MSGLTPEDTIDSWIGDTTPSTAKLTVGEVYVASVLLEPDAILAKANEISEAFGSEVGEKFWLDGGSLLAKLCAAMADTLAPGEYRNQFKLHVGSALAANDQNRREVEDEEKAA